MQSYNVMDVEDIVALAEAGLQRQDSMFLKYYSLIQIILKEYICGNIRIR